MECYLICFYSIRKNVINSLIKFYFIVMKNLLQVFGKDRMDEIVFANRNKAYGAYALRNEYSNQLTKALLVGVAFFGSLSIIPLVISALKADKVTEEFVPPTVFKLDDVTIPDDKKPAVAAVIPPKVKTVASPEYTPVRVVKKNKPEPTDDDKKNAAISNVTSPGPETTMVTAPPVIPGPPTVAPHTAPVPPAPVEDPNIIIDGKKVDVSANFKGGIDAFRQKVAQGFDTGSVDQSGMVSGVITFVVEKDGSISNIKINGENSDFNKEAERTVKSIKSKWTPAQLNGKTVRSSFRMPISMRIE
ncbi:outer membrane transport energization protein TonB [Epilithonimonas zeae]|uniref:Outer membrane transport energization protein TonB n=2 Tax=Epilithonimonas zeae TaxID=1416779 RepID=A0A1N6DVE9_9FLAO|nr:outer membrane transport energization protein TonB [Epilithonimonas zeae]